MILEVLFFLQEVPHECAYSSSVFHPRVALDQRCCVFFSIAVALDILIVRSIAWYTGTVGTYPPYCVLHRTVGLDHYVFNYCVLHARVRWVGESY